MYEENKETSEWHRVGKVKGVKADLGLVAVVGVIMSPLIALGAAGLAVTGKGRAVVAGARTMGRAYYPKSEWKVDLAEEYPTVAAALATLR